MDFDIRITLDRYLQDHLQHQVFDMDINTDYLNRSITASYEDFDFTEVVTSQNNFSELLDRFVDESNMARQDLYKKALVNGQRFDQSLLKVSYKPTKSKVLALGLGLELSKVSLEALLASAGYELSESDKRDLVIEFFIERSMYDLVEINTYLKHYKEPQLGDY